MLNSKSPKRSSPAREASTSSIAMLVDVAMTVTRPPTRLPKARGSSSFDSGTRALRLAELATGMSVATTPVFERTLERSPDRAVMRRTSPRSCAPPAPPPPRSRRPSASASPLLVNAWPKTYIDAIRTTALEEKPLKPASTSRHPVRTSTTTTPSAVTS